MDRTFSPGMRNKVINRDVYGFSLLEVPQSRDHKVAVKGIYTEGKRTKRLKSFGQQDI